MVSVCLNTFSERNSFFTRCSISFVSNRQSLNREKICLCNFLATGSRKQLEHHRLIVFAFTGYNSSDFEEQQHVSQSPFFFFRVHTCTSLSSSFCKMISSLFTILAAFLEKYLNMWKFFRWSIQKYMKGLGYALTSTIRLPHDDINTMYLSTQAKNHIFTFYWTLQCAKNRIFTFYWTLHQLNSGLFKP